MVLLEERQVHFRAFLTLVLGCLYLHFTVTPQGQIFSRQFIIPCCQFTDDCPMGVQFLAEMVDLCTHDCFLSLLLLLQLLQLVFVHCELVPHYEVVDLTLIYLHLKGQVLFPHLLHLSRKHCIGILRYFQPFLQGGYHDIHLCQISMVFQLTAYYLAFPLHSPINSLQQLVVLTPEFPIGAVGHQPEPEPVRCLHLRVPLAEGTGDKGLALAHPEEAKLADDVLG